MADKKMTMREFCEGVIKSNASEEIKAFATTELAKLDARNEKRKNTKSKEQIANEGLCDKIVALIKTEGAKVASEIGAALEVSTQKASALCKILVDGGELVKTEIKVEGKGKLMSYSLGASAVVLGDTDTDTAE